jgi:hypothetical protein
MASASTTTAITFVNNRGGVGKTSMVYQVASTTAATNPNTNVLVLDLSVYGDATHHLLGGLYRDGLIAPTMGEQVAAKVPEEHKAAGLVRALLQHAADPPATASRSFNPFRMLRDNSPPESPPLKLDDYMVQVHDAKYNPKAPANLFLVCGGGKLASSMDSSDTDAEQWWTAAQELRKALDALAGDWIVFLESDHLTGSATSRLAMAVATRLVVPLSTSEADFSRLFNDPTGNSLIAVMEDMVATGRLRARIGGLVFNKISCFRNEAVEQNGMTLPFTPPTTTREQIASMSHQLYHCFAESGANGKDIFENWDAISASVETFREAMVLGFRQVPDTAMRASTLAGVPLSCMPASGVVTVGKESLRVGNVQAVQRDLERLSLALAGGSQEDPTRVNLDRTRF